MDEQNKKSCIFQSQLDNFHDWIGYFKKETETIIKKMEAALIIMPGQHNNVSDSFGRLLNALDNAGITPEHQLPEPEKLTWDNSIPWRGPLAVTDPEKRRQIKYKPRRVLLVDSDPETRRQIKAELESDDTIPFTFAEAATYGQALTILAGEEKFFELLIFESSLEKSVDAAVAFLIEARKYFPRTRIVFTTDEDITNAVRIMKAGSHDLVSKAEPTALENLHQIVRTLLNHCTPDNNEPGTEWKEEYEEYLEEKYDGKLVAYIDGKDVDSDCSKKRLLWRVFQKYGETPYLMYEM